MKIKHLAFVLATIFALSGVAGAQSVSFSGLYHNNTNLNAKTEAIPNLVFSTNTFLEVHGEGKTVDIYFLTASPAGNGDVSSRVRLFPVGPNGFFEDFAQGSLLTNIEISSGSPFHATPAAGSVTVDLWRARWTPPAQFTGTVYYAPQVRVGTGGNVTDARYLIASIGANPPGTNFGVNSSFWATNAQAFGQDYFNIDYSFVWTNPVAYNFDYFYFNNPGSGAPETESVPGLGGQKFFQYNYDPAVPSYVYQLAPQGELLSMQTRFFYVGGPGEVFRNGAYFTNVVISSGAPFHGLPASGAVTLDVWRTTFYPPAAWSNNSVYYANKITTLRNGTTWMATDLTGLASGIGVTNNWAPPQYLWTDGPVNHDWGFSPTSGIVRDSVKRDYLYHNNTNLNPQTEAVPGVGGATFLKVTYATTTTTFYVITDRPANAVPGESLFVQMRIDYDNPESGFNGGTYYDLNFDQNLVLDSGTPFHGLPASGSHTVDLWRLDWQQPRSTNAPFAAFTNAMTIYYAPFIKTTGAEQLETDYTYLLAVSTSNSPNNYVTNPQYHGKVPQFNDYAYLNQFVLGPDNDGDGMADAWELLYFGNTTNSATGDNDSDNLDNLGEYIADTNPTNSLSFFNRITNITRLGTTLNLVVNPSSTARVYDAYAKTNLLTGTGWLPYGLSVTGNGALLQLTVTNTLKNLNYRTGVRLP